MKNKLFSIGNLKFPCSVVYPTEQIIHYLRLSPCCKVYELTEEFEPLRQSVHLPGQKSALTGQQSYLRQYLIKANRSLGVCADSGLLRWGDNHLLYELNQAIINKSSCFGTDLNPSALSKRFRQLWTGSFYPPGWYNSSNQKQIFRQRITHVSTHNNPSYFHWLTMPGQSPIFLEGLLGDNTEDHNLIVITGSENHPIPSFAASIFNFTAPQQKVYYTESSISTVGCSFALQDLKTSVAISPKLTSWLSNKINQALGPQLQPKSLLFVSRGMTKKRACINELEVYAELAPFGFEWCCLESLSVDEQFRLFRKASCVVSAHGAALTNLIACQPKTKVVELMPGYGHYSHYFMISDILELEHSHIIGNCIDSTSGAFYINPADVVTILGQLSIFR